MRSPRLRVKLARSIIRMGKFIQSLSIMVMRSDDLIEFSRQTYSKPKAVESWSESEIVNSGLNKHEEQLFKDMGSKRGRMLLLGIGGGREVIPLAKAGFSITGIDFVADMVSNAEKFAAARGITLRGLVQEISSLQLESDYYDVIWLSGAMYSTIPTSKRRIRTLETFSRALKADGNVICQFHWDQSASISGFSLNFRKLFALLTLGNLSYETGDQLWGHAEFVHAFSSKGELENEFNKGGFKMTGFRLFQNWHRGAAILIKASSEA
ncbi:methyltransferase domain-containing protein [candidate division KSB1 bacterium]|nr:methyltransferase domain-containing protein [candidate division KSB1 bacterium]